MRLLGSALLLCGGALLTACATTPSSTQSPVTLPPSSQQGESQPIAVQTQKPPSGDVEQSAPQAESLDIAQADPDAALAPKQPQAVVSVDIAPLGASPFEALLGWNQSNTSGALRAFRRVCAKWSSREQDAWLKPKLPQYGRYQDWESACYAADYAGDDAQDSRRFFEQYFRPVGLVAASGQGADKTGLLTGYYEPEISVRRRPDSLYSEPILSRPQDKANQNLARKSISAATAPVIAYGQPIDVFFMQVQGSGRIRFDDGEIIRAAYAAHNGHRYKSIGTALIKRGEMTKDEASKQSIEAWMKANGLEATRELMNENPRYVFFRKEALTHNEGPKGSMGIPLEPMATVAIDSRYHPYGSLLWIETKLPQYGGDYKGAPAAFLVSAQDSGNAIKGPLRADLYFGSGFEAGDRAGVMKHESRLTLLLPTSLAVQQNHKR